MKNRFTIFISLAFFFCLSTQLSAQQECEIFCSVTNSFINVCSECDNVIAADDCADAATPSICELDGFQTTTCAFTPDGPGGLPQFCGPGTIVHNNIWIGFEPAFSGRLHLNIEIIECLSPNQNCNGVQAAVARALCANPGNTFFGFEYQTLDCVNCVDQTFDLITVDAIAGVPHYIMIDGCCGDACEIIVNVIDGLPDPGWTLEPISGTLCPDILNPECLSPNSTALVYANPNGDADPNSELEFTWFDPNGVVMWQGLGIPAGGQQFSSLTGINPMTGEPYFCEPGNYTVTVRDLSTCCADENEVELFVGEPLGAAVAYVDPDEDQFDCEIETIKLVGQPEDAGVNILFENWWKVDWTSYPPERDFLPAAIGSQSDELTITLEDGPTGAGTYLYTFIDRDAFCISETFICVPADTIPPEFDFDEPLMLDCVTNQTVTIDATDTEVNRVIIDCTVGDIQAGEFPQEEIVPTTNYSVVWTSSDGNPIIDDNTLEPTVSNIGWYVCTITNLDNKCVSVDSVFVDGSVDPPTVEVPEDDVLTCTNNNEILLTSTFSNATNVSYNWMDENGMTVSTAADFNATAEGTYTLVVTNTDNNCLNQASVTITQNNDVPTIDPLSGPNITCVESTSMVDAVITGTSTYMYSWQDDTGTELADTEDFEATAPGTFTLIVTDMDSGCSTTADVTIGESGDLPTVDAMPELTITCATTSFDQVATATDVNGEPLEFEWVDGDDNSLSTTATLAGITTPGIYTVTATNPLTGCATTGTVNVIEDVEDPTVDPGTADDLTCANSQSITLDGTGMGGANLTYEWSDASGVISSTNTATATAAGTYTLTVTNTDNGCSHSEEIVVDENILDPSPDAGTPATLTCLNNQEVDIDGSASSGQGTLTYAWSGPGGFTSTNAMETVTTQGTYTLIITDDANGCTAESTVVIDENIGVPQDLTASGGEISCTVTDLDLVGSTSTANVSYEWTLPGNFTENTQTITVTNPGTYTLVVTNEDNGCTAETTTEVTASTDKPSVSFEYLNMSEPQLNCANPMAEILGTTTSGGGIELTWEGPNGPIAGNPIMVTEAGDYTLTAYDPVSMCSQPTMLNIIADFEEPVIETETGTIYCDPSDVLLNAEDIRPGAVGTGFTWTFPDNTTSIISNPTVTQAGIYTVVATGDNGCTSETTLEVLSDVMEPGADAALDFELTCDQMTYDLSGTTTTGNEFSWNGPGGYSSTDANPTIDQAGLYILTVTNSTNSCTSEVQVNITDNFEEPVAVIPADVTINCETDNVDLMGNTDADNTNPVYTWMLPDGSTVNTQMVNAAVDGMYTLIVENEDNGCSSMQTVNITADFVEPTASADGNTITCANPSVPLEGGTMTPGTTFSWSGPNGFTSTDEDPMVSDEGEYILTVTAANGCTMTATAMVDTDGDIPDVEATVVDEDVIDCDTDNVTLEATSSVPGAVFTWTLPDGTEQTGATILATQVGNYVVDILDTSNGCVAESTASVVDNFDAPEITVNDGLVTCLDPMTALDGSSSTTDVTYSWTGPDNFTSTDQNPMVDVPGDYILTVTDPNNGCTSMETLVVEADQDNPDAATAHVTVSELDCNNPTLEIEGISMVAGVEYSWTGPNGFSSNNAIETVTEAGEYTLTVLNPANSCDNVETIMVTADFEEPEISNSVGNTITCDQETVDISVASNEPILTYEWTGPGGYISDEANPADITMEGTYTVVLTAMDNGCQNSVTVDVGSDQDLPTAVAVGDILTCPNDLSVTLTGAGSSEGADFTYSWELNGSEVATTIDTDVSEPGLYTLTVFNNTNGCDEEATFDVLINDTAPTADAGPNEILTCAEDTQDLDGSASIGQGTLTYEWTNEDGAPVGTNNPILTTNETGVFTLTITDSENGCSAFATATIDPDENAPDPIVAPADIITCDITMITLDASLSSGQGNLTYEWEDANGNAVGTGQTIEVSQSGNYTLIILDESNGCDATVTVPVMENLTPPDFQILEPDPIDCVLNYTDVNLEVNNAAQPQFLWNGPGVTDVTTEDLSQVTQAGTYNVTVTDLENGCQEFSSVEVMANQDAPTAVADVDDELDCTTDEVMIDGTGTTTGVNYSWTGPQILSGMNSLNPVVGQAGEYTLVVIDPDNNCQSETSVMVNRNETVIEGLEVNGADANCFGPNTGSITIPQNGVVSGTGPFMYSVNGGPFGSQLEYLGLSAGTYPVVVEDALGCLFETEVVIDEATPLDLELTSSEGNIISYGQTTTLNPETNFDIDNAVWNSDTIVGVNPEVGPLNTTTYSVITYDENGCLKEDQITIFVEKTRPVYIPSGFSPNLDGVNDGFTVYADDDLIRRVVSLDVYDRWGGHMFTNSNFQPNNPDLGWNGDHRGENMAPQVFVYYALVEFIDGEIILYEGDVTLIR